MRSVSKCTLTCWPIVFHQELPPVLKQRDFLVFLACGVGLCIWLPKAKPLGASALAFAASAATFTVAYHNAIASGVVPLEFSLLTILVLFSTHVLLGYFFETHEKQKIIDMFGQFVPPTVVDQIAAAPEQLKLDGEARELSVMFCAHTVRRLISTSATQSWLSGGRRSVRRITPQTR